MIKFYICVISCFLSFNVFAACTTTNCSGIGKEVLLSIYPNASGNVYLQVGEGREKLDCNLVEGHFMVLKPSHILFDEIYSTILTGLASQKKLIVRIKNGSPICEVSYVRMYM